MRVNCEKWKQILQTEKDSRKIKINFAKWICILQNETKKICKIK